MAASKDYYQVLGVSETATVDEIKKAFRRLAKQYHPDRNPTNAQAAERFKEINEAHDVLSDADKRKRYDQLRRYGAYAGAGRGGGAGAQGSGGAEFDLSDLGSFGGLGDLFSSIFGRRGAEGGGRADDEDEIETTVTIPFRVAALGGKVPVTLPMAEVCPTCSGSGAAPGATLSTCPECRGRGVISFGQGGFAVNRPCPVCRGRGRVPSERCHTCGGSGEVRVEKRLVITVPAGTEDGTKLRLRGQGTKGKGDVVVVLVPPEMHEPSAHASQQLGSDPTHAVPSCGALQSLSLCLMLHFVWPCSSVRQQVTKSGLPQVDCAAQCTTASLHSWRSDPSLVAASATCCTQLMYLP